jgi:hypothetical protein
LRRPAADRSPFPSAAGSNGFATSRLGRRESAVFADFAALIDVEGDPAE